MTLAKRLHRLERKVGATGTLGPYVITHSLVEPGGECAVIMVVQTGGEWQRFTREPNEDNTAFHARVEARVVALEAGAA